MNNNEYTEIDLAYYGSVILKRKQTVLSVFLVVFGAAVIFILSMPPAPKIYITEGIIEVGKVGIHLIEEPEKIQGKISEDIYEDRIREKLGLSGSAYPELTTEKLLNTNLIKVAVEGDNPESGKMVLNELIRIIIEEHQKLVDAKIESLMVRKEELEQEVSVLTIERKRVRELVNAQRFSFGEQVVSTYAVYVAMERLFEDVSTRLNSLRIEEENIWGTKIFKNPEVRELSQEKINSGFLFVVGAFLALFLGILSAFGRELWDTKIRKKYGVKG